MTIAIVGVDIASLLCADRLQSEGHAVIVFDTGRAVGGRMATRHVATALGAVAFDHGAPYLTMRDPHVVAAVRG